MDATIVPNTTSTTENEKKRPRESDLNEDAPDEKRPRLMIDTTQTTTTQQQPSQASTPVSAATPKSRLALLERLKSKVTQIDNVIKEVPIPQTTPAPVQASPAPAQKVQKSTPPSNKKASKQKKPRPSKDADEYNPMSEEEDVEADRPRRQRKPNRYTLDGDDFDGDRSMDPLRRALHLLRAVKAHKWAWPFLTPVDPVALGIPDYFTIVKKPMDLGTVEQKLLNNEYPDIFSFADDVNLIWSNCFLYNQPQSDVVKMGESIKKFFDDKFKKLSDDVLNPPPIDSVQPEYLPPEPKAAPLNPPKPKAPPKKRTKKTVPVDSREMNFEEKKVLSENIEKLDPDQMVKIVQIIQQRAPKASSQANESEIEIDLDKLDAVTLRQLEKYVHTCLNKKKPKKKKPAAPKQAAPVQQPSTTTPAAVSAPVQAAVAPTPAKDESESSDTEESSDDSSDESSSDEDDEKKAHSTNNDASGPQSLAQAIA